MAETEAWANSGAGGAGETGGAIRGAQGAAALRQQRRRMER